MPKHKHGSGTIYQREKVGPDGKRRILKTWCLDYYYDGKRVRESSGTTDRAEARKLLQQRLGQVAEGRYFGPAADRVTFEDLAHDLLADYRVNNRRSLAEVKRRITLHLAPFFGGKTAHRITSANVKAFIAQRQDAGASNGEINRELAALKRMYALGADTEKIAKRLRIKLLAENNARKGFFEEWEYASLLAKLPDYLRPPVTFAYLTGWRLRSEILPLTWPQVDLHTGTVRLEPGTTKNKDGRLIYLNEDLRAVLEQQWVLHQTQPDCPYVFPRRSKRVEKVNRSWNRACREAGLVGKIPHDLRRTAVRNMVRAGIPERVAMQMAGHKTRSVFDRYHIVADSDLREAAQKLSQGFAARNGHTYGHTSLHEQEDVTVSH